MDISKRIKRLRLENGMTLKDVSEKTDLSVSFLSQIERGTTSLTITSLKKIADVFKVSMASFFEDDTSNHSYHLKAEDRKPFSIEGSAAEYCRLNGDFSNRLLEPLLVTLRPREKQNCTFSHPGEEFYYVLSGTVLFYVGEREYLVKEGDTIHFPSKVRHYWENPLPVDSILLCVLTPTIF